MYSLSVGSKTFLAGEYLALSGKPALLLQTEPRFTLQVTKADGKIAGSNPFHPQSPAGQLYLALQSRLQSFEFRFVDLHQGRGGFGGSSAEFLLLKSFYDLLQALDSGSELELDLKNLLDTYWSLPCHSSFKPSGADLIGQRIGGLVYFAREAGILKRLSWTLSDLDFVLVHTGVKLATHSHLQTLDKVDLSGLENWADILANSLEKVQATDFINGINGLCLELDKLGYLAPHSFELMQKLKKELPVLACKGCGAMGSDVLFVVIAKSEGPQVRAWLEQNKFYYIGGSQLLSGGLEVKVINEGN